MRKTNNGLVEAAKQAALDVLLNNRVGPCRGLPRTAAWGYPEPYTRDLMIAALGILVSKHPKLVASLERVLSKLAKNQTPLGHMPSLVHDRQDRGASDTTPLFLMAVGCYRLSAGQSEFLTDAVDRALTWMTYQSPENRVMVAHLPTSDWRDEQWILGYGLYVNTVVYAYLRLLGDQRRADQIRSEMSHFAITAERQHRHVHAGLRLRKKPYYAAWVYKVFRSERFDLLGNSLAILTGVASPSRSLDIIHWVESECRILKSQENLAVDLPPNFFPFIRPEDPDWRLRYDQYNQPGEYHNGGIWPFICGFYIAALVAAGRIRLAGKKLLALTELIRHSRTADVDYGFNEWHRAQDGTAQGQDWQTWSAAMYVYAAECVQQGSTPFFDEIRNKHRNDSR